MKSEYVIKKSWAESVTERMFCCHALRIGIVKIDYKLDDDGNTEVNVSCPVCRYEKKKILNKKFWSSEQTEKMLARDELESQSFIKSFITHQFTCNSWGWNQFVFGKNSPVFSVKGLGFIRAHGVIWYEHDKRAIIGQRFVSGKFENVVRVWEKGVGESKSSEIEALATKAQHISWQNLNRRICERLLLWKTETEKVQYINLESYRDSAKKWNDSIPKGQCWYCGRFDGEFWKEHITPRASKGSESYSNVLVDACCKDCNDGKRRMHWVVFLLALQNIPLYT